METDEAQLADLARRLGGRDVTWEQMQEFARNPLLRGIAKALGVDLSSFDRQHEQAMRSLVMLARATALLAPLGWAVSAQAPKGDDYAEAVELYDQTGDSAAVDELLTEAWGKGGFWLRRAFGPLPTLGGRHEPTRELLLKRSMLLRKALDHHEKGHYEASVLMVLTQIDGLTYDLTDDKHGFFSAKGHEFLDDATVAGLPENLRVVWKSVVPDVRRTGSSGAFKRNAILHGRELGYGTKTNSTKAFALLVAVLEWLKPKALELTEARQLADEARWAGSTERDKNGRWRDARGFSRARDCLWMLRTRESSEFRQNGRYRDDLEAMFPVSRPGLMEPRDQVEITIMPDAQTYWAWLKTDSDFYFGVAASGGKPDLLYADVGPPGPPGEDVRWISELDGPSPDWNGG